MKPLAILILFIGTFKLSGQWTEVGGINSLSEYQEIHSICNDKVGNVYASGNYGSQPVNGQYVSKWNGQSWSKISGINTTIFGSICTDENGTLYAVTYNSTRRVSKWDGISWIDLGEPIPGQDLPINELHADNSGNLYASCKYANGNPFVARWNSTSNWTVLSAFTGFTTIKYISSICTDKSGAIYATGTFTNSAGNYYLAKWDGNSWAEVGGLNALAANKIIMSIHCDLNDNLFAGGYFTNVKGNIFIAKWDGTKWSQVTELATAIQNYDTGIIDMCSDSVGNLYVGGALWSKISSEPIVFKWNGSELQELFGGPASHSGFISMCTDVVGNLHAIGVGKHGYPNNFVAMYANAKFVGIKEQQADNNFKIYPNPCSNTLNFKNLPNTKTEILLYDITGKVILSKALNTNGQTNEIDVSALSNGLYIAELHAEGRQPKRLKVVKD